MKADRYKNAKSLSKALRDIGYKTRTIDILTALAACDMTLKKYGGYEFGVAEFSVTPIADPRKAEVDSLQAQVDSLTEELTIARASKEDIFGALSGKVAELEGRLSKIDDSEPIPDNDNHWDRNVVVHIIPELAVGQLWKSRKTEDTYRIVDVDMIGKVSLEHSPSWRKIVVYVADPERTGERFVRAHYDFYQNFEFVFEAKP